MFNGIVYNQGVIKEIKMSKNNCFITIKSNMKLKDSEIGSSISCNGVCLTLIKKLKKTISFYLSKETLIKSNFKKMKVGQIINLEKSLSYGKKISGHYVQGHIDSTGLLKSINKIGKSWVLKILIEKKYMNNIIYKGSICINGVSLTISKVVIKGFELSIIPHTLKLTNLIYLKKNDLINIEYDIFGKYLYKLTK